jgi:hypothetical protein
MRASPFLAALSCLTLTGATAVAEPAVDPRLAPACAAWAARAVFESEDARSSTALLVNGSGGNRRVRIGDRFDGLEVAGIAFNWRRLEPTVWLWDGRGLCQATFEPPPPAKAPRAGVTSAPAQVIRFERSVVPSILSELRELTRGVRVRPELDGTQIRSVALSGIRRGTFLDRLGVRNGDRVMAIDGEPIGSMDRLLRLHARLATEDDWKVTLKRGDALLDVAIVID